MLLRASAGRTHCLEISYQEETESAKAAIAVTPSTPPLLAHDRHSFPVVNN